MAASTKSYNANKIILGPADLWLDVGVPSAASRITLTSGTPDSVGSPNAIHVGMTEAGCTVGYKPDIQLFSSDELTAPHLSRIIGEALSIKGNLLQIFDWSILNKLTVGGTKNTNTSTTSGYEEETIGGLSTVPTMSIVLIGTDIASSSLNWVVQLYKTFNATGFEFQVTRKDQSKVPFEFTGLAVTTRASGDQVGNLWHATV